MVSGAMRAGPTSTTTQALKRAARMGAREARFLPSGSNVETTPDAVDVEPSVVDVVHRYISLVSNKFFVLPVIRHAVRVAARPL